MIKGFGGIPLPISACLSASSFPLMLFFCSTLSKNPQCYGKHIGQEVDVVGHVLQTVSGCTEVCLYNHMSFNLERVGRESKPGFEIYPMFFFSSVSLSIDPTDEELVASLRIFFMTEIQNGSLMAKTRISPGAKGYFGNREGP